MKKAKTLVFALGVILILTTVLLFVLGFRPLIPTTTIQPNWDAWQTISTITLTVVTLFLTIYIACRQEKLEQGIESKNKINQIYSWLFFDKDIEEVFYLVEYNNFKYPNSKDDPFHGSELEKKLDKTLYCLNYICDCIESKVISEQDCRYFKYRISRFMKNESIKEYFSWLNEWYASERLDKPHPYLQKYNDN